MHIESEKMNLIAGVRNVELYLEFIRKSFQERFAYRLDFYISIFGTFLFLFLQINLWTALYSGENSVNTVTLSNMIDYIIISCLVTALTKSSVGNKIAEKIETGKIVSDFTKPLNFKYYLWSEDLGNNSFNALFITMPLCLVIGLINKFSLPSDPLFLMFFVVSFILGAMISFYINYLLGLFAFWLHTSWFITWFLAAFNGLFSGAVVPLWFYPDWLRMICDLLPFRFIFFEPISIYLGRYSSEMVYKLLLLQIVWVVLLIVVERVVWTRAQKHVFVNGG